MKLLIATPAFGGMIATRYFESFMQTMAKVNSKGHQMTVVTVERDGLGLARNGCASAAIEHGFDKILFIDADIVWRPDQVMMLLESDKDIIAGTYPYKSYPLKLVFNALNDDAEMLGTKTMPEFTKFLAEKRHMDPSWNGELEVRQVPTGFLMIKTKVLKELTKTVPKYTRQNIPGTPSRDEYNFFRVGLTPAPSGKIVYETEDFGFCHVAQENGFKVYLQTKVVVDHLGTHIFSVWGNDQDASRL